MEISIYIQRIFLFVSYRTKKAFIFSRGTEYLSVLEQYISTSLDTVVHVNVFILS